MIDKIRDELAAMGFSRHYLGFEYLAEAIELINEKPPFSWCRDIYPIIAERHNTGEDCVARCIHFLVTRCCEKDVDGCRPSKRDIAAEVLKRIKGVNQ